MSRHYTANDICRALQTLDSRRHYGYLNPKNHGEIQLVSVTLPEGPVKIRRRKAGGEFGREESISPQMLWRAANALGSGIPVNFDRVFAGSYNTRSVLEALLAHTAEIYTCLPGRQESIAGQVEIKRGHKHIILCERPHEIGRTENIDLGEDCVISEIPSLGTMYDVVPSVVRSGDLADIEICRRHAQIQVALTEIAKALGMRSWLAVEDHGIRYNGKPITEYRHIVRDLNDERSISGFSEAVNVAKHIDCLYFNGGLPFAFEVEHSTGVTSGLVRMSSFMERAPHLNTHCVIVADDANRDLVMQRSQPEQFEELDPQFMPYSNVEDIYSFIGRHGGKLRGVKKDFLMGFMEPCRTVDAGVVLDA